MRAATEKFRIRNTFCADAIATFWPKIIVTGIYRAGHKAQKMKVKHFIYSVRHDILLSAE